MERQMWKTRETHSTGLVDARNNSPGKKKELSLQPGKAPIVRKGSQPLKFTKCPMQFAPTKCCVFCDADGNQANSAVFRDGPTVVMLQGPDSSHRFYQVSPILVAKRGRSIDGAKMPTKKKTPTAALKKKRKRIAPTVDFLAKRISNRKSKGTKVPTFAQQHHDDSWA